MSGHPHEGKRSNWFKCSITIPPFPGLYEWCHDLYYAPEPMVIHFTGQRWKWGESYTVWCAAAGYWRGLAEKPG